MNLWLHICSSLLSEVVDKLVRNVDYDTLSAHRQDLHDEVKSINVRAKDQNRMLNEDEKHDSGILLSAMKRESCLLFYPVIHS